MSLGERGGVASCGSRQGNPCWKYLVEGMSEEEVFNGFPDLRRGDIRACLALPPPLSGGW